ncbi:uncharacterized protein H6S33_003239 [Morchella sextelata]|uniref:uncharacterized protein n=1 Tax=Morchella sextelata TaxID=1174677 RepID=UPI001D058F77|nr:uncharacterized protein H6S33_003239 [Morchella sextelata]KAH0607251.1 hypothetical protein H6S33_003239 [Morchella sextelata]
MSTHTFTISTYDIFTLLADLSTSIRIPAPIPPPGTAPFRAPPGHIYPPTAPAPAAPETPSIFLRRLAPPHTVYCPPAERTPERFHRVVARVWRIIIVLRRAKGHLRFVEVRQLLGWAEGWMRMLEEEALEGEQQGLVKELGDGLWGVVEVWGGVRLAVRG